MQAFSPTGVPIIGTADTIPGNALALDFTRDETGAIVVEFGGETKICWNGQRTLTTDPLATAAPALLAALKDLVREIRAYQSPECDDEGAIGAAELKAADAAIAAAEQPAQDLFVDEDGQEWPEDQIVLKEGEAVS